MNNQVFKVKISSWVGNQSPKASTNSDQIIKNTMKTAHQKSIEVNWIKIDAK